MVIIASLIGVIALAGWVGSGAPEDGFPAAASVLDRLCIRCHNPGGEMSHVPFARSRAEGAQFDLDNQRNWEQLVIDVQEVN